MRIAIVTTWFERGAAYVSKQIADVLEAAGHEVYIYSRGGEQAEAIAEPWVSYHVTRDPTPRLPMTSGMNRRYFEHFLGDNKIDLVLFNEQRYWAPVLWTKALGLPTIAYVDYYTDAMIKLFAAFDGLICNTKRHYDIFSWHRGVHYVPWGTDVDLFVPQEGAPILEGVKFFHSAGMNPFRKGTDLIIEAALSLHRTGIPFGLVIHSQVPLKRHLAKLRDGMDELHRAGVLVVHEGTVPAPGLYGQGNVYVYPSRLDGIGLTVAEALSSGLPVITTDNPPMNEFVPIGGGLLVAVDRFEAREDGYYWPMSIVSHPELATAMRHYIDRQGDIPKAALIARRHAVTNLNWHKNAQSILPIFETTRHSAIEESTRQAILQADHASVPFYELLKSLYNFTFRLALGFRNLINR